MGTPYIITEWKNESNIDLEREDLNTAPRFLHRVSMKTSCQYSYSLTINAPQARSGQYEVRGARKPLSDLRCTSYVTRRGRGGGNCDAHLM